MAYSSVNLNTVREFHLDDGLNPSQSGGKPRLLGVDTPILTSTHTIVWDREGVTATEYALKVGRSPGGVDIADLEVGDVGSYTLSGLPIGQPIYVTLLYKFGLLSPWYQVSAVYNSSGTLPSPTGRWDDNAFWDDNARWVD